MATTPQAVLANRIRQLAERATADTDREKGGRALLSSLSPKDSAHIAIAVAAHRLLQAEVIACFRSVGCALPDQVALVNLLASYLDGCGRVYRDGAWLTHAEDWALTFPGRPYPSPSSN